MYSRLLHRDYLAITKLLQTISIYGKSSYFNEEIFRNQSIVCANKMNENEMLFQKPKEFINVKFWNIRSVTLK